MLPLKPLTLGSLALNVVLGTWIAWTHVAAGTAVQEQVSSSQEQRAAGAAGVRNADALRRIFKAAVSSGVAEGVAYELVVLTARGNSATAGSPYEYWKPPADRSERASVSSSVSDQAVRELLLQTFGPSVRDRPELSALFEPYARQFPFLTSEKQLALLAIRSQSRPAAATLGAALPCPTGSCGKELEAIRSLLTAEEFFEYQLRESTLAVRLTNTGFDFTEQEFRDLFRVLSVAGGNPAADAMAAGVRGVLAKDRFAQYQRLQDPAYRLLRQAAQQFALPRAAIDASFEAIKTGERKIAALQLDSKPSRDEARTAIYLERDRVLQAQLGSEVVNLVARYLEPDGRALKNAAVPAVLGASAGRPFVRNQAGQPAR
jgi:hypothetical protein